MFLFGKGEKKKKEDVIQVKPLEASDIYMRNINEYVEYYGKLMDVKNPLDDMEFYERIAVPYYNAAMNIVNFVNDNYSDEMISSGEVVDFDINGLINQMTDDTKRLFFKPNFPSLIYIDEGRYFTHFHVQDDKVYEAEGVEVLPGLSRTLANEKINRLFEGLSPVEVRDLLQQMSILPRNTELEKVIKNYNELVYLNKRFLESVICLLIVVQRNKYSMSKARFLADSLGIYFDFSILEQKDVSEKKLAL